jgi:hypothetical protein
LKEIRDGNKTTNSHWRPANSEKPIICVDYDHTITGKCSVCKEEIYCNEIQEGAKEVINELAKYFRVWIFSGMPTNTADTVSRKKEIGDLLDKNEIHYDDIILNKPLACFIIDDRAVRHTSWKTTFAQIKRRVGRWPPKES